MALALFGLSILALAFGPRLIVNATVRALLPDESDKARRESRKGGR